MNTANIIPAITDREINAIAELAEEIWHQHFTDIIGTEQVVYMVERFQSYPALKEQISNGYEYYQIYTGEEFAGYTGIHEQDQALFLSKLYLKASCRGQHLCTQTWQFLVALCRERKLNKIWLTCNKYNADTLAVYRHLGFQITDEQVADIGNGYVMDDYILTYLIP